MKQFREPRFTKAGKPICEICGKSFAKLMAHVTQAHDMPAKEYKKKFGHDPKKSIISKKFSNKIQDRIHQNYDQHMAQLRKASKKTQFKKGNQAAKGGKKQIERTLTIDEMIQKIKQSGLKKQKNSISNNP